MDKKHKYGQTVATVYGSGCTLQLGCLAVILVFNLLVGGWSVDYLLDYFLQKDIPFLGDALIGAVVGEISVPVAIVVWLLVYFGAI